MESDRESKLTPRLIIESVFFVVYLFLGLAFIFVKQLPFNMDRTMKIAFGVLLILYSAVRLSRIVKHLKQR